MTPVQQAFQNLMTLREGRKNKVYRDTVGTLSVGIGHKVTPADHLVLGQSISDAQVDQLFLADTSLALKAAADQAKTAGINDDDFLPYLAAVNFQLGVFWRVEFPHTWGLIAEGDYRLAAARLDGSLWQKQTPVRVADFQGALRALAAKQESTT
jgi:GH24 family phage-related lysozyme (muramidase)